MKKLLITTLIGGSLVSPLSAAFMLVDFSDAATWDAANPTAADLTSGGGPVVFNNVLGIAGCTITLEAAGQFTGGVLSGAIFDNRTVTSNTYTVTFGSVVDFQIEQTTHHGPDERDTLTVGGGTFDNTSFVVMNDTFGQGLPIAYSAGDTVATIGAYPYASGDSNTSTGHPEWTINGTGSSFTFQHETFQGDGNAGFDVRNSFQFFIDTDAHPAPEPSQIALLGLGSLAMLSRRRR